MTCLDHIKAHTYHGRKGPVSNAFRYAIDYVLIDLVADVSRPTLFSRNQFNLMSLFGRRRFPTNPFFTQSV